MVVLYPFSMLKNLRQTSRRVHLWGALLIFLPVMVVIVSGLLLQVKKQVAWVQPVTHVGTSSEPSLSYEKILAISQGIATADISSWRDIKRLDIRPSKGIVKVQSRNSMEIQLDAETGRVLQVAERRSDWIESLHDGSWFFDAAKLWVFLPAGVLLLLMWLSGLVMLVTTLRSRYRRRKYQVLGSAVKH